MARPQMSYESQQTTLTLSVPPFGLILKGSIEEKVTVLAPKSLCDDSVDSGQIKNIVSGKWWVWGAEMWAYSPAPSVDHTADSVSAAKGLLSAEWLRDKRGEGRLKEGKVVALLGILWRPELKRCSDPWSCNHPSDPPVTWAQERGSKFGTLKLRNNIS